MAGGKKGKGGGGGKAIKRSSSRVLPDDIDIGEDVFEDEHRNSTTRGGNKKMATKKSASATTKRIDNNPVKPNSRSRASPAARNALLNSSSLHSQKQKSQRSVFHSSDDDDEDDDIEEFIDDEYENTAASNRNKKTKQQTTPARNRSFRSSPGAACPSTRTVPRAAPTTRGTARNNSDTSLGSSFDSSSNGTPPRRGVSRANSTRSNASFKSTRSGTISGVTRTNSSRVSRSNSTRSLKSTTHHPGGGVTRTNSTRSLKSQSNHNNNRRSTLKSQQSKSQRSVTSHTSRTTNTNQDRSSSRNNSTRNSTSSKTSTTKWQRPTTMFSPSNQTASQTKSKEDHLRDLLGQGAYHLPGHNWWQDWLQYFGNNHPLFCPFLQHPMHPVPRCIKAVQLVGSIMVGLVLTNVIYLLVIYEAKDQLTLEIEGGNGTDTDTIVLLGEEGDEQNEIIAEYTQIQLDPGMWVLWTVGGAIHAIWDNTVWYATACACFDSKLKWVRQFKKACNFLVIIFVTGLIAAGTLAILIRAHVEGGGQLDADTLMAGVDSEHTQAIADTQNYVFLMSYAVELAVAWFLWFPIIESILFTGILSKCCPCIPFLSGRPGEVKAEQEYQQQFDLERGNTLGASSTRSRSRRY